MLFVIPSLLIGDLLSLVVFVLFVKKPFVFHTSAAFSTQRDFASSVFPKTWNVFLRKFRKISNEITQSKANYVQPLVFLLLQIVHTCETRLIDEHCGQGRVNRPSNMGLNSSGEDFAHNN